LDKFNLKTILLTIKYVAMFWDVFFPKFCLGCDIRLKAGEKLACPSCLELLAEFEEPYSLTPYYFVLPLWEKKGMPESWLYFLLQGKTHLAEVFAALIVYRFSCYEIDVPEAVTFIPTKPYLKWSQGFCGKKRVAEAVADLFEVPCRSALKWEGDELVSIGVKEKRLLVIETHNDEELSWGGIEMEKRELMGAIITTSSDGRSKTCPSPKRT